MPVYVVNFKYAFQCGQECLLSSYDKCVEPDVFWLCYFSYFSPQ